MLVYITTQYQLIMNIGKYVLTEQEYMVCISNYVIPIENIFLKCSI